MTLFNEKVKVPGGLQTIEGRKRMKEFFANLKAKGLFQKFESYEKWEKARYKEKEKKPLTNS